VFIKLWLIVKHSTINHYFAFVIETEVFQWPQLHKHCNVAAITNSHYCLDIKDSVSLVIINRLDPFLCFLLVVTFHHPDPSSVPLRWRFCSVWDIIIFKSRPMGYISASPGTAPAPVHLPQWLLFFSSGRTAPL
jgi:hypothetical protein